MLVINCVKSQIWYKYSVGVLLLQVC